MLPTSSQWAYLLVANGVTSAPDHVLENRQGGGFLALVLQAKNRAYITHTFTHSKLLFLYSINNTGPWPICPPGIFSPHLNKQLLSIPWIGALIWKDWCRVRDRVLLGQGKEVTLPTKIKSCIHSKLLFVMRKV